MVEAILIDLDGTIFDCSERHYACYSDVADTLGISIIPFGKYWSMKRARCPWRDILGASATESRNKIFAERFIDLIESPRYLALDRPFPEARSALTRLRTMTRQLILVTMRRSPEGVEAQLHHWDMLKQFDLVLVRGTTDSTKSSIARDGLPQHSTHAIWIGDTEEDIVAAHEIGVVACAVCGGIRNRGCLEAERPELIADGLSEASSLIADSLSVSSLSLLDLSARPSPHWRTSD